MSDEQFLSIVIIGALFTQVYFNDLVGNVRKL